MKNQISYSPEVRERAVRLVFEQQKSMNWNGRRSNRLHRRLAAQRSEVCCQKWSPCVLSRC